MTTPLPEDIRKQIEQEADILFPYIIVNNKGSDNVEDYSLQKNLNDNHILARMGYKSGAEKYAEICQQKDEQIKQLQEENERLRKALTHIDNIASFGVPGSFYEIHLTASEALKQ